MEIQRLYLNSNNSVIIKCPVRILHPLWFRTNQCIIANFYFYFQAFKPIKLDHISSHDVNPSYIWDMTVMRETGLIVVSTLNGALFQFSLQEGRLIEKEIRPPCEHYYLYLLCVQIAGHEYLALSCYMCENIRLMDLNKQTGLSSESKLIQYEVITAFSGDEFGRMCHGEENRLFVRLHDDAVLELDTSTTTFTKVRYINTGYDHGLCYVPDPHRFLVVSYDNEFCAVTCDSNKEVWKVKNSDLYAGKLAYTPTRKSIIVADRSSKKSCHFESKQWVTVAIHPAAY